MRIFLLIIFIMFPGCMVSMQPVLSASEHSESYKIGIVQEALLGDPMIIKETYATGPGYRVIKSFQPPKEYLGSPAPPLIEAGSEWAIIGNLDNGATVCKNDFYQYPDYCLMVDDNNEAFGSFPCAYIKADVRVWRYDPEVLLERVENIRRKGSFKQVLIYTGRTRDGVKFSYHEFLNDMKIPVIVQDLNYDLSDSKFIGFRSMKVEILGATNQSIKFSVLSPM